MSELTMIMLGVAILFYILRIFFKSDELNVMSVIMPVVALACVWKDWEADIIPGDDLILFVAPMFYIILMSAVSMVYGFLKGDTKK